MSDAKRYALFVRRGDWPELECFGASIDELLDVAAATDSFAYVYQVIDMRSPRGEVAAEGSVRELRQERCEHLETHVVQPPSGDVLVSGAYQAPGTYCSDCGKRLGD